MRFMLQIVRPLENASFKTKIRGGHGAPWFCPTLIGMPKRLFLLIVWSEDPGAAKALLNA